MGDSHLNQLLAAVRARLQADGLALVTRGRDGQALRVVSAASVPPSADDALLGWLASQPKAVVADADHDNLTVRSAWLHDEAARSLVAVPVQVDGAVAGTLVAFSRTPDHFGAADAATAELFAEVMGPALEWLWRAQAAESVLEVANMVHRCASVKDLVKEACERAVRLCDGARASLWLFDPRGRHVASFSANAWGQPDRAMWERFRKVWPAGHTATQEPISRWMLETRAPLVLDDYAASPFADPAVVAAFGTRSLIAVPLLYDDRVVGIMSVDRTQLRPFSAAEVRLASSMAATIAPVVERARVLDETEAELRQAEAQVEIARSLSSTLELKPLLRMIAQHAARACGMDRCSVFLYEGDRLAPVMSQFADGRVDPRLWEMFKAQDKNDLEHIAVVEEAIETRAPVIIDDAQQDPRVPEFIRQFRCQRLFALPLTRRDKVIGVLVLEYIDHDRPIRPAQVHLGVTIGAQIALTLENARLLAETRSQAGALRDRNAELDSFVHTVSHDLKAPLVAIQGMSGLLLTEHTDGLDAQARHYLERIQVNTAKMERLLVDLLALTRIGREGCPSESVSLCDVVREVLAELDADIRARGIRVVVGELPTVWARRVQMDQVVRNLLGNAVKYMGDAPVRRIEIGSADHGEAVEVWVRDTGIGINPAYHQKVFELFQRFNDVDVEGTGVGLPIVKKIVEAAGGRIWVQSARGKGSTFRFLWPATRRPEPAHAS